jgi:hypothetical protein
LRCPISITSNTSWLLLTSTCSSHPLMSSQAGTLDAPVASGQPSRPCCPC